jgi:hypothetical protein
MFPDLRNNLKSSGSSLYECSISYSTLKRKHMTVKEARDLFNVIDPEWPGCLQGYFDIVFINEAHTFKEYRYKRAHDDCLVMGLVSRSGYSFGTR